MATVVGIRFPWGRYHATPWDRSVNEASVEWPPSTWRLLRALFAVWKCRVPELRGELVGEVLAKIAMPPDLHAPRRAEAHTRHYLPDTSHGTDKVLDPFVVVERNAELLLHWDQALADDERACLVRLCSALPYLGRAESLCSARLLETSENVPTDGWISPGAAGDLARPPVRLLAPSLPLDLDALTATSRSVRSAGYPKPPGSRWVSYDNVPPAVSPARRQRRARDRRTSPTTVLLGLDAAALPSVHDTAWVGHVARKAALDRHGDWSPTLGGRREAEKRPDNPPLLGHRHAHYLALDSDEDRLLDTVAVWAPEGFTANELDALGRIDRLWSGQPDFRPVRVRLLEFGTAEAVLGPQNNGMVWQSTTPFVPYRHQKRQTIDAFLAESLQREANAREIGATVGIESLVPGDWLGFRRARPDRSEQGRAFGLRIRFSHPVDGPISLGALSHFGLGQFKPVG